MTNTTIRVPREHLVIALCLPLAVIIGYFLAGPSDTGTIGLLFGVFALIAVPILLKWHHPLLLLCWNASIAPTFIRGQLPLWMLAAGLCFMISILSRAVDPDKRFISVPWLTRALVFFAGVVIVTALLTGGIGFRVFGSARFGGKHYLELLAAIGGYFALTSQRIAPSRAGVYVLLFFLPMLTYLASGAIYAAGHKLDFLYAIFPASNTPEQFAAEKPGGFWRYGSLAMAGWGIYCCLLARFGLRGVFDLAKPWRLCLLILAALGCAFSGFRGSLVILSLTCAAMFCLEGLWRTRALLILAAVAGCGIAILIPCAEQLPAAVQRSLSFLPIKLDPAIRADAQASSDWRLDMWKAELEQVPKYLTLGKGYLLDPHILYMADESAMRGVAPTYQESMEAGDFHSGPLSIVVPFGIAGVIAFGWLMAVALRLLYCNYRYGDPALLSINTLLLAAFAAELVFFVFVFGSLHDSLCMFTGIAALSVSLNGGMSQRPVEQTATELEELQPSEAL